jgi:hypothetical protein
MFFYCCTVAEDVIRLTAVEAKTLLLILVAVGCFLFRGPGLD